MIVYWPDIALAFIVLCISMSLGKLLLAYRSDYQPIASLFKATENSMGFNAILRIAFAPVVIVCSSIILYSAHLNVLVKGIWLVAVYYFIFQTVLIILLGRWRLLNKMQFFLYHLISIALSFYFYQTLITKGLDYLLPDPAHLRTEMWLAFIAFFYSIFKSIPENEKKSSSRRRAYINAKLRIFRKKYCSELKQYDKLFQEILLSIMIYESFNRPKLVRIFEDIIKAKSRGIMQFVNAQNDQQSINLAGAYLKSEYEKLRDIPEESFQFTQILYGLFRAYNPQDSSYSTEVKKIFDTVHKADPREV